MTDVAEQAQRVGFVSVEAAARFLGISRGMAYQQAHQHLEHGTGLRCVRIALVARGLADSTVDVETRSSDEVGA